MLIASIMGASDGTGPPKHSLRIKPNSTLYSFPMLSEIVRRREGGRHPKAPSPLLLLVQSANPARVTTGFRDPHRCRCRCCCRFRQGSQCCSK